MRSFPELELEIVGDGPEMARLKLMAKNDGTGERIKFSGRLSNDETLSRMKDSDIFAMPSTRETFGMVYLEAMSKGCITIGSRDQGIDGTIVDGRNGFLVKPGDTEELVGKISLIKDLSAPERERILLSALQTLEDMTEEKAASEYVAFVETVLQREGKDGK
jgi:glycosyltransferase involved in cell wall biosynthesis